MKEKDAYAAGAQLKRGKDTGKLQTDGASQVGEFSY